MPVVFSKIVRRTHMYLALFLIPWVLMYTVSTFVMNHRAWFRGESPPPLPWQVERQSRFDGEFSPDATPRQMALLLLASLDLDGAHSVNQQPGGTLVIQRMDPVSPRRITFKPSDRTLSIERLTFESAPFLERMHRRRGFQQDYATDDVWAVTVDAFIVAVVFWALSGLWMWWELKVTRKLGALFLAGGIALFGLFLVVL